MAFRFSLQTALEVRKRQEKIKMKELAEKVARQLQIQDKIDHIGATMNQGGATLDQFKQSKTMTLDLMQHLENYRAKSRFDLQRLGTELGEAKTEVEQKRQELIKASQKRKTLEILRDKDEKKYWANITRQERMALDEIASNLYAMRLRKEQSSLAL